MAGDQGEGGATVLASYFRSLFENTKDGIIQSGCIRNREHRTQTTFLYMAGSYGRSGEWQGENEQEDEPPDGQLDYLILGSFTPNYICRMIDILTRYEVGTVILPYLAPIQRLVLAKQLPAGMHKRREVIRFLDAPLDYLKAWKVKQVYFLYENGAPISGSPEFLPPGSRFEPVEDDILKLVYEMEGCELPLVKAGYIALEQWLFYFGVYGPDIRQISKFVLEELSEDDSAEKIGALTEEFLKQFGEHPYGSVMMYHGPLGAAHTEKGSLLTARVFHRDQGCGREKLCDDMDCVMKCMHERDFEQMQCRKGGGRFGIFLTGNVNMRKYFSEVAMRFWKVRDLVRVVTLPNCGAEKYWNARLLQLFQGRDTRYWVCPIRSDTGTRALLQIVTESSFNRLVQLNYEYGFCLSGYLANDEE